MSQATPGTRPFGVLVVAVLIFLAAIFNIVFGFWMMFAPYSITDIGGNEMTNIPTFYLVMNGILSVILGLMYFWLTKLTLIGSATAHLLISFLAVLNIVFALFRLPYGWLAIALNVVILLIINTSKAKAWFQQTA
ncbi:MAG: hypothetical protein F2793_04065 [Actinobacteria bacterium]|uniref:Unannotated protein n=1 Tax=freshwater metagenome TaxID=449393 RepID=A0A6J7DUY7_9ZZZZ|nr:hypothetical protein [Actinomycetota bacterium]